MEVKIVLICSLLWVGISAKKNYAGSQAFTLMPNTPAHIELLKGLQNLPDVDFWEDEFKIGQQVEILAPSSVVQWLRQTPIVQSAGFQMVSEDIQTYIDGERNRKELRHSDPSVNDYDPADYNTYEDILAKTLSLVQQCPAGFNCEYNIVGQSLFERDMVVFRIYKDEPDRRSVWIDTLIHAREWLAGSTTMRVLEKLVTEYGMDQDVTRILDAFDFYIMPVVNPDGYVYSWESDRFWRKSRNVNEGSSCIGTDLNRNFDVIWAGPGTSPNPCSETYHGSAAASEPETQVVQQQLAEVRDTTFLWLTIHTAANAWLAPYGNQDETGCLRPDDSEDLQRAVDAACKAIEETHDTDWRCGNGCEILYAYTGSTQDYAKENGIKYAYTPELRGPGFAPGVDAIQPSYEETWNGIAAILYEISDIEGYSLKK